MAYTVTRTQTVVGNLRAVHMDVTADAATQTIETGLKNVVCMNYGPLSMNSSNIHMAANSNATGTASFGVVAVTGCTSGDHFFITVYGM